MIGRWHLGQHCCYFYHDRLIASKNTNSLLPPLCPSLQHMICNLPMMVWNSALSILTMTTYISQQLELPNFWPSGTLSWKFLFSFISLCSVFPFGQLVVTLNSSFLFIIYAVIKPSPNKIMYGPFDFVCIIIMAESNCVIILSVITSGKLLFHLLLLLANCYFICYYF